MNDQSIFVTGASGFVGAAVVRDLLSLGCASVSVLVREPAKAWRLQAQLKSVHVVAGGIEDLDAIGAHFSQHPPHSIVDLAWEGVSGADRNDPVQWRNIKTHLDFLALAKKHHVQRWIGLGSQAEYGPHQALLDETTRTSPSTLYGMAKLATCQMTELFCRENNIEFAWMRLFSSYGPRDNPDWLIPYVIRTMLSGQLPQLTKAEQRWDYVYIDDVAQAVCALINSPQAAGIFNLGSGLAHPLKQYIETIRDLINPSMALAFGAVPYRTDQVMHLQADINKLKAATGWKPIVKLDVGLRQTVDWYRKEYALA